MEKVQDQLREVLENLARMDEDDRWNANLDEAEFLEDARVDTFEEQGYLTNDDGLVLRLRDGRRFQVTILDLPDRY